MSLEAPVEIIVTAFSTVVSIMLIFALFILSNDYKNEDNDE